jgi:phospholipid/cholesterol/gamma-HCH transport system permease protein
MQAGLIGFFRALGVLRATLYFSVRPGRHPGAVARYMYEIGNRSMGFLCIAMGFIGMIFVYQAGLQMLRLIPDLSLLGATYLELLVRDLAASISALLLATRVGAGIAAEIGSMVVTEQVDALRMCATDPIDYLIRPRFLASLMMTTVLVIVAGCIAGAAGMWTAYAFFSLNPATFLNTSLIDEGDIVVGLAKCVAYGGAIPVVSGYCGLSTYGGSEGVGAATTRAVVNSSLTIIALDFLISGVGYLVFG